jgi:hypothetical protein
LHQRIPPGGSQGASWFAGGEDATYTVAEHFVRRADSFEEHAMVLNEQNLRNAFREVLTRCGFGAAETEDWETLMSTAVLIHIPEQMQHEFPDRLLAAAVSVCGGAERGWSVIAGRRPSLTDSTTFGDLLNDWFRHIVRPPTRAPKARRSGP